MSLSNHIWTQEKVNIYKEYTWNYHVRGEHMKEECIYVDYSQERIHMVLTMEKNTKCEDSSHRKGTCESLAVAPPQMSFRTIIPYTW